MNAYAEANKVGKEGMDNALRSFSVLTKGFQQIAAETTEFTKKSYEQSAQMLERLSQVRTLDKAVEVQTDYAKTAYDTWLSQTTKFGEIYSEIAREAYRPFEKTAFATHQFAQDASRQAS